MSKIECNMAYSLGRYVRDWCDARPDCVALVSSDGKSIVRVTYRQVYADTMAWADYLRNRGVKEGDRVVFISTKSMLHSRFFYSCWHLGAIAVPVCETLGDTEMAFILNDCEPALIIADKPFLKKVQANAGSFPVVEAGELPVDVDCGIQRTEPADVGIDAIATLIYTSGSTGMPKGVMLSHKNLWVNAFWNLNSYRINFKDSLVSLLPYWHAYALSCEILCVPMCNASCIVPRDIRDFKKNLGVYKPTVTIAVPRIIETFKAAIDKQVGMLPPKKKALFDKAIYNASRIFTAGPKLNGGMLRMLTHYCFYSPLVFSKLRQAFGGRMRLIVVGGAPMDLEMQIFFKYIGMPTMVGYGLTESSPVVCNNTPEHHKMGSCGMAAPWLTPQYGGDFTFKDDEGNMGKDVHGQLLIKGDCVMKGYWHHTDESAKSFEDGWLNTGDVGHCDKEGYIFIHGRKGNMLVLIGGEKLHPEHVEDAVKNSPYISEAMVIGEKCKSVYVCVNIVEEKFKGMSPEEVLAKVKEEVHEYTGHLAAYQKPRDVLILPEFNQADGTLTATLKIRRFKIRELYRDEIERFLVANGEEIATKHTMAIASSRVIESRSDSEIVGEGGELR